MNHVTRIFTRIERLVRSTDVTVASPDGRVEAGRPSDTAQPATGAGGEEPGGPAHAPGHRHLGPPPDLPAPPAAVLPPSRHPAWHDIGGRIDRLRRNERHG